MTDDGLPDLQRFYDAIGRVTAEAVSLEQTIRVLIPYVDGSRDSYWSKVASLRVVIDTMRSAVGKAHLDPGTSAPILQVLDAADALRRRRNVIVHATWTFGTDEQGRDVFLGFKPAGGPSGVKQVTTATVAALYELAAELHILGYDFWAAMSEIVFEDPMSTAPFVASPIVNPHGHTPDGRSITVKEARGQGLPIPPEIGPV